MIPQPRKGRIGLQTFYHAHLPTDAGESLFTPGKLDDSVLIHAISEKDAYTVWMAGGGVKGGLNYGSTNEQGNEVAENPLEVRDLHATILHLLGINHETLNYRFQGLDQRLTGVEEARVIGEILG
jgi:Protein of unknown function (DUF1501)